jgi:hypothetical protein
MISRRDIGVRGTPKSAVGTRAACSLTVSSGTLLRTLSPMVRAADNTLGRVGHKNRPIGPGGDGSCKHERSKTVWANLSITGVSVVFRRRSAPR